MRVSKLTLQNFKSFRDVSISFGQFNVVIGANASGKSNLVQAFQFLEDIASDGLENAVSLQGGIEFLRNMTAGPEEPVTVSVEFESPNDEDRRLSLTPGSTEIRVSSVNYAVSLKLGSHDNEIEVVNEKIHARLQVTDAPNNSTYRIMGEGIWTLSREYNSLRATIEANEKIKPILEAVYPSLISKRISAIRLSASTSLLEMPVPLISQSRSRPIGYRASIYDLDPRLSKRGISRAGKADLESDGGNLAIVVKDILRDKEKSRKFHNLIGYLMPYVEKVSVEELAFNSMMMNFRESYAPERDIPATFISDGTIGITAALVAFAFEGNDITILEEPDRNVHPRLISGLTSLMKDVSRRSQILITTHNPEFVRLAGIENLILVHRDKEGFSRVSRPADSEIVKIFLSEEIGIDDLHMDGFLPFGA